MYEEEEKELGEDEIIGDLGAEDEMDLDFLGEEDPDQDK